MKKAGFSFILFSLLLLFIPSSFAQNITTGNATSKSTVKTTTNGSGTSTTRIETTVNGKTEVIESNSNGTIEVINNNGNVTVNKSPEVSITMSPAKSSTPSPSITPKQENKIPFISNLLEKISSFIQRIFTNL